MSGFNSITGDESIMTADNCSFDGTDRGGRMILDGQLWIGSTASNRAPNAGHVRLGAITSPLGTVVIGYAAPNITLDIAGGTQPVQKINMQTGTSPVVPSGGILTFNGATVAAGTNPVRTDGTGANTMALEVQISQAIASTDATKIGLANFNSAQFTVDANGFVSAIGNNITWQTITASQTLVKNHGYICISAGGALALALPTTASSTIGDIIEVTLDGATSWSITQAASQQIRFGSTQTTSGATGSLASLAQGDTIRMVYQATGKWNVLSSIGNLTVT